MHATLEALLFLARESRAAPREICDVAEVVRDALEVQRRATPEKDISFDSEVVAPQRVQAPSGMVHIVVANLLQNAVEHTRHGRVVVRLDRDRLVVADTGSGISPDDLAHVFRRGYRGAHSRGYGLGLYLVKRICENLDWRIEVASTPGSGTRFTVSFQPAG